MTQAVAIGLSPFFGGSLRRGAVMNAVSGPASFEALGGTWTLGDLSPVLWFQAGEGITAGGTEATIAAVGAWTTNGAGVSADGDWLRVDNTAPNVEHYAQGGITNPLATKPGELTIDLRRGAPPAAEASSILRVYPAAKAHYVDINLDTGTLSAKSGAKTPTITPLGASPDDGYRVVLGFDETSVALRFGLLASGSLTYADPDTNGYFRVKEPSLSQPRVASWLDRRGGAYVDEWVQAADANQPVLYTDDNGACVAFAPGGGTNSEMSMHGRAALGGGGSNPPITIAAVVEWYIDAYTGIVAFKTAAAGKYLRTFSNIAANRVRFERNKDANWTTGYVEFVQDAPGRGVSVARYDGTTLRHKWNGVDGTPAAHDGAFTPDELWLGSNGGGNYLTGRIRELAIWDRSLSDAEATAAYLSLRAAWVY